MTVSFEQVRGDLEALVAGMNNRADGLEPDDPLVEVSFSLRIVEELETIFRAAVVIDRNSGGSPESDYAIRDSAEVEISADGSLTIAFFREMVQQFVLEGDISIPGHWPAALGRITGFCEEVLPLSPALD